MWPKAISTYVYFWQTERSQISCACVKYTRTNRTYITIINSLHKIYFIVTSNQKEPKQSTKGVDCVSLPPLAATVNKHLPDLFLVHCGSFVQRFEMDIKAITIKYFTEKTTSGGSLNNYCQIYKIYLLLSSTIRAITS